MTLKAYFLPVVLTLMMLGAVSMAETTLAADTADSPVVMASAY